MRVSAVWFGLHLHELPATPHHSCLRSISAPLAQTELARLKNELYDVQQREQRLRKQVCLRLKRAFLSVHSNHLDAELCSFSSFVPSSVAPSCELRLTLPSARCSVIARPLPLLAVTFFALHPAFSAFIPFFFSLLLPSTSP